MYKLNSRQIELIKKRYDVDEDNKIVKLVFNYHSCDDLINTTTSSHEIKEEVLLNINSTLENIPSQYKVDINFNIEDYQEYNPEILLSDFNDALELNFYKARYKKQKRTVLSMVLMIVGVFLLLFMMFGKNNELFGTTYKEEIITEIIDIGAWVFVWESVSMLFLEYSESTFFAFKIKKRVNRVNFINKNNILVTEESKNVFTLWESEKKIKKIGKLFLLVSSTALLITTFYHAYVGYNSLKNQQIPLDFTPYFILMNFASMIFTFLVSIEGYLLYLDKENNLSKYASLLVTILLCQFLLVLLPTIILGDLNDILSLLSSSIFTILYIIGYFVIKNK